MSRFTSGLVSGLVAGVALGMANALSDERYRERKVRDSRRAMKRAGHMIDDIKHFF